MKRAIEVYAASDGELTKAYYAELENHGELGIVAMNLFRAQKCSARAKKYRRRSHKDSAYRRKEWSLEQLCEILAQHSQALNIRYGWKEDPAVVFGSSSSWVLYVDLPNGQVSFHSPIRGNGPYYPGEWDKQHASERRILKFCDMVMRLRPFKVENVTIRCPECELVQDAKEELYYGDTIWTYVHHCIGCKYVIMESEWDKIVKEDGNEINPYLLNGEELERAVQLRMKGL
jgi:hypothetical protein